MKKTLLAIALAAGTTLFAAPQATTPDTTAPKTTKTTKTTKTKKAKKHHSKKDTSTTTNALPRK